MARNFGTATLKGPRTYTIHGVTFLKGIPTVVTDGGVWSAIRGNSSFFDCSSAVEAKSVKEPSALHPLPDKKKRGEDALDAADLEEATDSEDDEDEEKSKKSKKSKKGH